MTAGPAPHRLGEPSPLIFHLSAALAAYQQGLLAAPRAGDSRFPWAPHLAEEAARVARDLDSVAVAAEIGARLAATARGLEIWQAHPFRRDLAEPPSIWSAGSSRLLDFGQAPEATDPAGPPVLVVPSLINRPYILDLLPERSMLRWLAAEGLRPVQLDWGPPGEAEAAFDLDDYGRARLAPALAHLAADAGRPVAVLGYCMGGTLAAGLAARAPDRVAALATIGAPWDFADGSGIAAGLRTMIRAGGTAEAEERLEALGGAFGFVPVSAFQLLFALVNPLQAALKFQRLARLDPRGPAARLFVALEDWLADGVPMAWQAARDLLVDWQTRNATARGEWRFLGGPVRPGAIACPTLSFCGTNDTIAPTSIGAPLPRAVPGARLIEPPTGHVGMIVGSAARARVWRPLADFLRSHAG